MSRNFLAGVVSAVCLCVASRTAYSQADASPAAPDAKPAPELTVDAPTDSGSAPNDPAPAVKQTLILVVGSAGTPEYAEQFLKWAGRWTEAAERADADVIVIGADAPAKASADAASAEPNEPAEATSSAATSAESSSDTTRLAAAIERFGAINTSEPLWLIYFGHGTFDGRRTALNLRGTDVTEEQLSKQLAESKRPVVAAFCCSCSSPFINALSGPNRVVISATKDGNQVQYARFGDAFSVAIGTLEADIDRDGQVSLLEAWLFASRRTAEFYTTEGRLATEHSLLDDNGDQKGTRAENYEGLRLKDNIKNAKELDGKLSSRWVFVRSEGERKLTTEQRATRDVLEQQLEALREKRDTMDESAYLVKLESLLRPLAELYESAERKPDKPAEANAETAK